MKFINPTSIPELYHSYTLLQPISRLYPNFSDWFFDKVIPGVILGKDKVILLEKNNEIAGISIIKKGDENKLRCVRVSEKYQRTGLGLYLIDESLKQLDCAKPVVSVAEEMMHDFSRMFINRYDFDLSHVYNGLYRKGKLEYEFNGNENLAKKSIIF